MTAAYKLPARPRLVTLLLRRLWLHMPLPAEPVLILRWSLLAPMMMESLSSSMTCGQQILNVAMCSRMLFILLWFRLFISGWSWLVLKGICEFCGVLFCQWLSLSKANKVDPCLFNRAFGFALVTCLLFVSCLWDEFNRWLTWTVIVFSSVTVVLQCRDSFPYLSLVCLGHDSGLYSVVQSSSYCWTYFQMGHLPILHQDDAPTHW